MIFIAIVRGASRRFTSRTFTTLSNESNESYTVIGRNINFTIPATYCTPLEQWFDQKPVMNRIRPWRLIRTFDATRRYQMEDDTKNLFWTALLHSEFAKSRLISLKGLLNYENLGVVNGLRMLCFKNLPENSSCSPSQSSADTSCSPSQSSADTSCSPSQSSAHTSFSPSQSSANTFRSPSQSSISLFEEFMELILQKELSSSVLNLPQEWDSLFVTLKSPDYDMDDVMYHPAFLSNEEFSDMCIRGHRLLRQEMPMRKQAAQASSICSEIATEGYNDTKFISICRKHFLLSQFLGVHSSVQLKTGQPHKNPKLANLPYPPEPILHPTGCAAVDTMRIGCVHSIENELLNKICSSKFKIRRTLLNSYKREEVILLLQHSFPKFGEALIKAFKSHGLSDKLGLNRIKPIPSILNV